MIIAHWCFGPPTTLAASRTNFSHEAVLVRWASGIYTSAYSSGMHAEHPRVFGGQSERTGVAVAPLPINFAFPGVTGRRRD